MDLSYAAAVRLGVDRTGTARVRLEAVGPDDRPRAAAPDPAPAPARSPAPESVIASTDPAYAGGEVTLQVGSFAERENARRLAERLRDAGVDAVDIDHVERDGRDLWRVRVGPVPADDLATLRERLRGLELPEPRVVRD
jgi:rare lipoprotein A